VCADLYGNTKALISGLDNQFHYQDVSRHSDFRNQTVPMIEEIKKADASFYRMEKTFMLTVNDPLGMGYRGMSHYSSLYNLNFNTLMKRLGFAQSWYRASYEGSTVLTDSLFGFKYILSKDEMPSCYKELKTSGDITVYENPFVLPVGFMVGKGIEKVDVESNNRFTNQNNLLNTLCGSDMECFFAEENVQKTEGSLAYTFTAAHDLPVYISFPTYDNPGGSLFVNGSYKSPYFTADDNHIVYIGQFEPGTEVKFSFNADPAKIRLLSEDVYYLDTAKLEDGLEKLGKGGLYNISYKRASIKAEVNAAEAGVMFTSIPYDKGFTVKVDGKKVKTAALNDTFMIFDVSKGRHELQISYTPYGFWIGLSVSIASLLLVIYLFLRSRNCFEKKTYKTV